MGGEDTIAYFCALVGSGLGTMMATALVHNGARVIIASRKEKQLKEVAACFTGEFACSADPQVRCYRWRIS